MTTYRARHDRWAKFLIAPLLIAAFGGGAWVVYSGVSLVQAPSMLVVQWLRPAHELTGGVVSICISGALLSTMLAGRYRISDPEVVIDLGIDHRRVPLSDIIDIVPTASPFHGGWINSPAWSRDALQITYRSRKGRLSSVVIAPVDWEAFVGALVRAAPHLHSGDEGAVPAADRPLS